MNAERIKQISRKIVADGIDAELRRVERLPEFRDAPPIDQAAIQAMVKSIADGAAINEPLDFSRFPL